MCEKLAPAATETKRHRWLEKLKDAFLKPATRR
jgi:hypothetical protein